LLAHPCYPSGAAPSFRLNFYIRRRLSHAQLETHTFKHDVELLADSPLLSGSSTPLGQSAVGAQQKGA
jgi:hypothetical protein